MHMMHNKERGKAMTSYDLFGFQVELDEAATCTWYATADMWGCTCKPCQNFLEVAKNGRLPISIKALLERFQIPPEKATYVCELYRKDMHICYQFSYRIAGKLLEEKTEYHAQSFGGVRCCHEPYPYGALTFPTPHFDLEFSAELPWILNK